jgi:hypothetical protein
MDPALYKGIDLLGPEVVARAEAFAAQLSPGLRVELGALLAAVDNASQACTIRTTDAATNAVLPQFGIDAETWWDAIEALPPTA